MGGSWKDIRRKNCLLSLLLCFLTHLLLVLDWVDQPGQSPVCKECGIRSQSLSSSWFYSWFCLVDFPQLAACSLFFSSSRKEAHKCLKNQNSRKWISCSSASARGVGARNYTWQLGNSKWMTESFVTSTLPWNLNVNVCYFLAEMIVSYQHLTC